MNYDDKDYYQVLNVSRQATQEEIKKSYRRLARKYHPDVSDHPQAAHHFKLIVEAYDTLGDAEKRKQYDKARFGSPSENHYRPSSSPWDNYYSTDSIFDDEDPIADDYTFHQESYQTKNHHTKVPRDGQDIEITVYLNLEETLNGVEREVRFHVSEPNDYEILQRVAKIVQVRIPKGVTHGQKLKVRGRGGKGFYGGKNGDLRINVMIRPHPFFRIEHHDLYLEVPITPWEAMLGLKCKIPTLEGSLILTVPPRVNTGKLFRIPQRGLENHATGKRGDLFASIHILCAKELSTFEKRLVTKLSQITHYNPRQHFFSADHTEQDEAQSMETVDSMRHEIFIVDPEFAVDKKTYAQCFQRFCDNLE